MTFRLLLPVVALLGACSSEPPPSAQASRDTLRPPTPTADTSTYARLQGTWQSTEDPKSVIELRGHRYISYYEGVPLDTAAFILDQACPAEPGAGQPSNSGRYLVEPSEDMCWEVVGVDAQGLELSYTARGNTLNYRKMK
ncbi:hypothetical protein GCM10028824_18350 [Hymenobacter segetis]|uniref:Lipocalin-like domain-containing protein n=1 Tax=Hymenobacter segetis TaxID=2025509 RepID=A0ABU9M0Z9_9BACT